MRYLILICTLFFTTLLLGEPATGAATKSDAKTENSAKAENGAASKSTASKDTGAGDETMIDDGGTTTTTTTSGGIEITRSNMKISATAGLSYGIGDAYEYTDVRAGLNLGGVFHYNLNSMQPGLSAEFILNYTFYSGDEKNNYEYSYGMLEILAGAGYQIVPNLTVIGGLGLYRFMFEWEYTGPTIAGVTYPNYDYSETYLGLFLGCVYQLTPEFSVRGTFHLPDLDGDAFYMRINAAYSFQL